MVEEFINYHLDNSSDINLLLKSISPFFFNFLVYTNNGNKNLSII